MELAMVDDQIVPINQARISCQDRAVYYGDGVYEVLRLCNGKLFALQEHLIRFRYSLGEMEMVDKVDMELIGDRINHAVDESKLEEALVYFQISRGTAPRSLDFGDHWKPGFLLTVREMPTDRSETTQAITHPDWRWRRCDIKSLNLLGNVLAKRAATKQGVGEAILVDETGNVTEATGSSVMIVKDNELRTAPLSPKILGGITRRLILQEAPKIGLTVREKSFTPTDALAADEVLMTGTTSQVTAVTHLDRKKIAHGKTGTSTKKI
ncbi:MAG: aminotransferase class IV, partial [Planctomycetes bacterium]|nr:aminotransferase class IV [Planctomycetota bacterium]